MELMRECSLKRPVDPLRIYAIGFPMSRPAARLAPALAPALFSTVAPISGIAPANNHAPAFKALPVLVLRGAADDENPITIDRRFFAVTQKAGGRRIGFRQYAGLAHQPLADIHPGTA